MRLALRVVVRAARKVVHSAVDLCRYARFTNREIDSVAPDLMLPHDMNAVFPKPAQRRPCASFAGIHAGASFGVCMARRISQAPMIIMGMQSSMPMVM